MNNNESYIDHEVRLRMIEEVNKDIKSELKELRKDMRNQFLWTLGTIITLVGGVLGIFGSIVLHSAKLI